MKILKNNLTTTTKKLINKSENIILLEKLTSAESTMDRMIGLIKTAKIEKDEGLWISRCNSIHTLFMKFPIDCIFIDKNLRVKSLIKNVQPWRLVFPQWGASSVIELKAGSIDSFQLKKGDQLYVGD